MAESRRTVTELVVKNDRFLLHFKEPENQIISGIKVYLIGNTIQQIGL